MTEKLVCIICGKSFQYSCPEHGALEQQVEFLKDQIVWQGIDNSAINELSDYLYRWKRKLNKVEAERDQLKKVLKDIECQATHSFFSDCSRGVQACFAMQHIREIIEKTLTKDTKNE